MLGGNTKNKLFDTKLTCIFILIIFVFFVLNDISLL